MSGTLINVSSEVRRPIRTHWLALGVMLGLALVVAGCYHWWVQWCENRSDEHYRRNAYWRAYDDFERALVQSRVDDAFEYTTPEFQRRITREELEKLARGYTRLRDQPGTRTVAQTSPKPINRGFRAKQVATYQYTLQDSQGNQLHVSTTILIVDSIFCFHPPKPLIDDFSVTYTPVGSKPQ